MISIHPWIYNAIVRQGDILAVHPDYFQLTGGLERWLYRLARKAVPDKADPPAIRFKMETLHARSGVTRDLKRFAFDIRKLADTQPLPEYGVQIEYRKGQRELVTLYRDKAKPCRPPRGRRLKTIQGPQGSGARTRAAPVAHCGCAGIRAAVAWGIRRGSGEPMPALAASGGVA